MKRGLSFPRAVGVLARRYRFVWWHPFRIFPSKKWMLVLVHAERRDVPLSAVEVKEEVFGNPLLPIHCCPTCERPMGGADPEGSPGEGRAA